jgi:hypothetical protein
MLALVASGSHQWKVFLLCLVTFAGGGLLAAACSGATSEGPPRLALLAPREASGPLDSPAIQAAFKIQNALDAPAAQSAMEAYLGRRYGGDWIVNNGKRGVLYIGVIQLTAADQNYTRNHIHMGLHARFRLVDERYSMAQLTAFQALVDKYVEHHRQGTLLDQHPFASIGVSPLNDAVVFGVPQADAAFWIRQIQPLLPYDALVIEYGSPPIADTTGRP